MARPDPAAALAQSALFRALPAEELRALAREVRFRRVAADELLFDRGERTAAAEASLFLLLSEGTEGPLVQVSVAETAGRPTRQMFRLVGGEVAGDLEFLMSGLQAPLAARISTARALAAQTVLALPGAVVADLAERHPAFRRRMVRDAARRLVQLLGQSGPAAPRHPDVAFALALLDLFDDFGEAEAATGPLQLRKRLSQRDLAELMGMSLRSFSARVTDWDARGLVDSAPLALLDRPRVERIAAAAEAASAAEALDEAEAQAAALVAAGDRARGIGMAADALVLWPGHPALVFLVALGLARSGDGPLAGRVLHRAGLRADGGIVALRSRVRTAWRLALQGGSGTAHDEADPVPGLTEARLNALCRDVAALLARLAKDAALDMPPGPDRGQALSAAAALYAEVDASLPGAHACVNAATLHRLAAAEGGAAEAARARAMAARAAALAAGDTGWDVATRAEAALVLGDAAAAAALAARAAGLLPRGDLSSFRRQIAALERAGVPGAGACLAASDPGSPLIVSGPLVLSSRHAPPEAAQVATAIEAPLRQALAQGPVLSLHCSLAAGADLLAAHVAQEAGIPVDAVLPFALPQFLETSVRVGGGRNWEALLDEVLPGLRSLAVLWDGPVPPWARDSHFRRADAVLLGEARLQALRMGVVPWAVALGATGSAADRLAQAAAGLGFRCLRPPLPEGLARQSRAGAEGPLPSPFAATVFVQGSDDSAATRSLLAAEGLRLRQTRARRALGDRVLADVAEAADLARAMAARLAGTGLSVTLDHGPVLTRQGTVDAEALARLAARQPPAPGGEGATASVEAGLVLLGQGADPEGLVEMAFQAVDSTSGDGREAERGLGRSAGQAARRRFRLV